MRRCEPAVAELQATVAKLKTEDQDSKGASARLQARIVKLGGQPGRSRRTRFLRLRNTFKICHSALDAAISMLHLNVSVSHIEELRKIDKLILDGKKSFEDPFNELRSSLSAQLHQIFERLAEKSKLLLEQHNLKKAQETIENLRYKELESPELQITELDDDSYARIFTPEGQDIMEVQNLVRFLDLGSGLLWVSGGAASGKSTLMKFIARL